MTKEKFLNEIAKLCEKFENANNQTVGVDVLFADDNTSYTYNGESFVEIIEDIDEE